MMTQAYDKYLETQAQTASPGRLVLMLYDGAIRFASQGRTDLVEGKKEAAHKNLIKAQDILTELMVSLDFEAGEISHNLFALYDYMQHQLIQANTTKSVEPVDHTLRMLTELRDAWAEAMRICSTKSAVAGGR